MLLMLLGENPGIKKWAGVTLLFPGKKIVCCGVVTFTVFFALLRGCKPFPENV